jgi:ABC-type tungstate transport system substrate-binding protein
LISGIAQRAKNGIVMSVGTILIVLLIIFLLGGFSGRFGGYGYGFGHGGMGVIGTILIILVVLFCSAGSSLRRSRRDLRSTVLISIFRY